MPKTRRTTRGIPRPRPSVVANEDLVLLLLVVVVSDSPAMAGMMVGVWSLDSTVVVVDPRGRDEGTAMVRIVVRASAFGAEAEVVVGVEIAVATPDAVLVARRSFWTVRMARGQRATAAAPSGGRPRRRVAQSRPLVRVQCRMRWDVDWVQTWMYFLVPAPLSLPTVISDHGDAEEGQPRAR